MSPSLPIVICGESLLDVFQNGATPNGLHLDAVVGGSPLNVAAGVQRMGGRAVFFGAVSRDFLGDRILASIEQEGLSTEALVRCDAPTTLSLVGVDAAGVPSYRFYGHGGADRQLLPEHLAALPAQVAAIHFGSYGCVVEPIGSTLRTLVEARHRDTVISFDPNVRLNVEPALAVWRDHIEWMASRTHLLKLSDEDFERLYPGEDIEVLAARWLGAGVALVMMTRGGEGAFAWTKAGRVQVAAPKVTVQDTVGAGDTFQAATLIALAEIGRLSPEALADISLDEMSRVADFAARAAAITCTRRGPDLPRRAELRDQV
ncbi:ribokinase-like domain-containing protein [Sphaerotilus natans subsp. natans DSM 6575]|uniref:Ribokinase-like domain-containing protein n=1 Tax=Sphaerotilus natans subsp. natans DSM 6575 TaxID=1286631 RepID=A0A059KIY6_9BURK|nr:carbohydrate kinase [Sphaerotilus natans]KDB51432.1 ribokinase-like domain-containing protein [Sphaerotilus natans subsp. natans DSM 6575]SIR66715.1 fructokinase [Sphaerotilus natans]